MIRFSGTIGYYKTLPKRDMAKLISKSLLSAKVQAAGSGQSVHPGDRYPAELVNPGIVAERLQLSRGARCNGDDEP